jgi:hypothetical protein
LRTGRHPRNRRSIQHPPGCFGKINLAANGVPKINNPDFGFLCSNAPAESLGLGLVTAVPDGFGSDPLGIGAKLHVDLLSSPVVASFDYPTDAGGNGMAPVPLPNNPAIVGITFYAQSLWIENFAAGLACGGSQFFLVNSAGLSVTIQP